MSFATEKSTITSSVVPVTFPMEGTTRQPRHDKGQEAEQVKSKKSASEEEVQQIVSDINANLQAMHTELNFSVDKETEKMVLKVVNSRTHEVIRQIPAEDALRIASRISKLLGLLVDENV